MFESREKLGDEIRRMLGALRALGDGRYAWLIEPKGVLFEDADPEAPPPWPLRRHLESRVEDLFAIPKMLFSESDDGGGQVLHSASGSPSRSDAQRQDLTPDPEGGEDVFAEWEDDGFFLVFVNGRVAVVVTSPDPAALEKESGRILKVMVDRLIRYNSAWRADEKGRGLFFSRPRVDTVVVGKPD